VQFIYQFPETNGTDGDMLDAGPVHEVAAATEAAGFMGLAFTEHPITPAKWLNSGGHQTLDPFVALGCAAGVTSRIRLLTYLTVAPFRNPSLLAKSAATVDKLSDGRFILGMGTGYLKSEFFALGVDFDERNQMFEEALDLLPLHWSGEPFTYTGRNFSVRDAIARPRPVQNPIPIWIGGNSAITRQRVAERAQGWMPLLGPPELNVITRTPSVGSMEQLADTIAEMRNVASQRDQAIDVVLHYDDASIARPTEEGERHRAAFSELERIGATWIMIPGATHDRVATLEFLEGFGATYINP
jgi:probable F420-dependent oxidoreductase